MGPPQALRDRLRSQPPEASGSRRACTGLGSTVKSAHAPGWDSALDSTGTCSPWLGPGDTVPGDTSQTQKNTSCVTPLPGGPRKSQIHRHREQVVSSGRWGGEGVCNGDSVSVGR